MLLIVGLVLIVVTGIMNSYRGPSTPPEENDGPKTPFELEDSFLEMMQKANPNNTDMTLRLFQGRGTAQSRSLVAVHPVFDKYALDYLPLQREVKRWIDRNCDDLHRLQIGRVGVMADENGVEAIAWVDLDCPQRISRDRPRDRAAHSSDGDGVLK